MPLYEYACLSCKRRFELLRSPSEREQPATCPHCGVERRHMRVPSLFAAGATTKGTGGGCIPSSGFG